MAAPLRQLARELNREAPKLARSFKTSAPAKNYHYVSAASARRRRRFGDTAAWERALGAGWMALGRLLAAWRPWMIAPSHRPLSLSTHHRITSTDPTTSTSRT